MKFWRNDPQFKQRRRESRRNDGFRSKYLKAHGIEVIRFWDNEVLLDMQGVLNKLFLKVTPPILPFAKGEG